MTPCPVPFAGDPPAVSLRRPRRSCVISLDDRCPSPSAKPAESHVPSPNPERRVLHTDAGSSAGPATRRSRNEPVLVLHDVTKAYPNGKPARCRPDPEGDFVFLVVRGNDAHLSCSSAMCGEVVLDGQGYVAPPASPGAQDVRKHRHHLPGLQASRRRERGLCVEVTVRPEGDPTRRRSRVVRDRAGGAVGWEHHGDRPAHSSTTYA